MSLYLSLCHVRDHGWSQGIKFNAHTRVEGTGGGVWWWGKKESNNNKKSFIQLDAGLCAWIDVTREKKSMMEKKSQHKNRLSHWITGMETHFFAHRFRWQRLGRVVFFFFIIINIHFAQFLSDEMSWSKKADHINSCPESAFMIFIYINWKPVSVAIGCTDTIHYHRHHCNNSILGHPMPIRKSIFRRQRTL